MARLGMGRPTSRFFLDSWLCEFRSSFEQAEPLSVEVCAIIHSYADVRWCMWVGCCSPVHDFVVVRGVICGHSALC